MNANAIVGDARVLQVRNLKTALARANERLLAAEGERDFLRAHLDVALAVMRDFENVCLEPLLTQIVNEILFSFTFQVSGQNS